MRIASLDLEPIRHQQSSLSLRMPLKSKRTSMESPTQLPGKKRVPSLKNICMEEELMIFRMRMNTSMALGVGVTDLQGYIKL